MMRLLRLSDDGGCNLVRFAKDKIPPYAILSHTWGEEDDEVSFKDVMNGSGQEKKGFQKLQFCGNQAKIDGLQYFWVDTCCIDKSNSTELQTAINSMFRWYQNAVKCYVWLSDVLAHVQDGQSDTTGWESAFSNSRWFTRGWTLQELLASKSVIFYSYDYVRLGDKMSLEPKICEITEIAAEALQGHPLSNFSVDERLRWRETRQTTEEEDRAYCLLGIFDVSMPLVYGEGYDKAMRRLLREIEDSGQNKTKSTLVSSVHRTGQSTLPARPAQNIQPEPIVKKIVVESAVGNQKVTPSAETLERHTTAEVTDAKPPKKDEEKPPHLQALPVPERKFPSRTIVDRSTLPIRKPKTMGTSSDALGKTLVAAARGQKASLVEQLLDRGVNPNSRGPPDNATALFEATRHHDVPCMKLLLDFGADPELEDNLVTAARISFSGGVQLLLERGTKPNHYKSRWNAMNWACDRQNTEMSLALLRYGASGDDKNDDGTTNLRYSSRFQRTDIVEQLLAYGCDVELKSRLGRTALDEAIQYKSFGNTKLLLEYGANPLLAGPRYPLSLACDRNSPEILMFLLDLKVTYDEESVKEAMIKAAPNIECLEVLLKSDKIHIPKAFMESALSNALDQPECLKLLISHGADVTKNKGIVEKAVLARNIQCLNILLENGCDINEPGVSSYGGYSQTALARACELGLDEIVALLLSSGADPNVKATNYPLWKAVKNPKCLDKLFAAGADISKTPGIVAHAVLESRDVESVTKLLEGGGNPNDIHHYGHEPHPTALSVAARENLSSLVTILLARGADPNLNGAMLPIFGAASHSNPPMLEALIKAGADVNQPSKDVFRTKDYALRIACEKGYTDNVKLLLEAGADVHATNSKGASAIDAAAEYGHEDLVMLLLGDQ